MCTQKPSKAPRVQNSVNNSFPKVNEKLKTHEAPHAEDWETDLSPAAPAGPLCWTPQAASPVSELPLHSAQSTRQETQVPQVGPYSSPGSTARAPLHPSRGLPSEHRLRDHSLICSQLGHWEQDCPQRIYHILPQDSNTTPVGAPPRRPPVPPSVCFLTHPRGNEVKMKGKPTTLQ